MGLLIGDKSGGVHFVGVVSRWSSNSFAVASKDLRENVQIDSSSYVRLTGDSPAEKLSQRYGH